MRTATNNVGLAAGILLFTFAGSSLQAQSSEVMEAPVRELPEEVIITGNQPLKQLKRQIEQAQDQMFGLFNELNDDDRYDIKCREEKPLGTRISQRVCRPVFLSSSMEQNGKAFLQGVQNMSGIIAPDGQGAGVVSTMPPQAEIVYRYPILKEKMTALVEQNSAFADSVAKHHELLEEYRKRTSSSSGE